MARSWAGSFLLFLLALPVMSQTADLSVTVATPPFTVTAGNCAAFTVTVTNNGPAAASNVVLNDAFSGALTQNLLCTTELVQSSGSAFTCALFPNPPSCAAATLASGASATFTAYTTTADETQPSTLTSTATVSASTSDSNSANNTASANVTVVQPAVDIGVLGGCAPATVAPNGSVTCTFGSTFVQSYAPRIFIDIALPAGATLVSTTCTAGTPVSCSIGTLNFMEGPRLGTVVLKAPAAPGVYTTQATIRSDYLIDNVPGNNSASGSFTVDAALAPTIPSLAPGALIFLAITLGVCGVIAISR